MNHKILKSIQPLRIDFQGVGMYLDPLKALFFLEEKVLVVSDLHIGKAAYFRKNGIALPEMVGKNNFWNLSALVDRYEPRSLVFLGDLFHSKGNQEVSDFLDWNEGYPDIALTLVRGNHDILPESQYAALRLELVESCVVEGIRLVHDVEHSGLSDHHYSLSGHIHPCVKMVGKRAVNRLTLPCFWFGKEFGVLPAFGDFTGTHTVRPKKGERVFVCTPHSVQAV